MVEVCLVPQALSAMTSIVAGRFHHTDKDNDFCNHWRKYDFAQALSKAAT